MSRALASIHRLVLAALFCGALQDNVIPVDHARRLAQSPPRAACHEMDCGHNDWAGRGAVKIGE